MASHSFALLTDQHRQQAAVAVLRSPDGTVCEITTDSSARQRRRYMWRLLHAIATHVASPDGPLTPPQWRVILIAAAYPPTLLRGLDNTVVPYWPPQDEWTADQWDSWLQDVAAFAHTHGVSTQTEPTYADTEIGN